ncbi:MAG: TIGR00282 family metallophosphoesterase [Fimbriimonadaceae bacterium]|nr:TIGR00282 family metallophosphoesterase [Fimbriimonadaceae bacterium]QYK56331.1 MAG: TIGR00282 family metallophosphoesterase [Fimbriimonadaceae bacterium]
MAGVEDAYSILFLGDIVGRPGREAVHRALPELRSEFQPRFTIVNGENSASGVGITPEIADELFISGVDVVTLGNHAFNKKEIYDYLKKSHYIIRPANLPSANPGYGVTTIERDGTRLKVVNLCGRVFLDGYDDPFRAIDEILEQCDTPHVFIDFHAEATSEKVAFGFHVEGRATAVVGTHTHVTTADEQVLPGGTAYITDVGMCGPQPSVIGVDKDIILHRFRTGLPTRFEVAEKPGVVCGVVIKVEGSSGRALAIQRIRRP